MLIGYARISKADESQVLDLQIDALIEAGIYKELTSTSTPAPQPRSKTVSPFLISAFSKGFPTAAQNSHTLEGIASIHSCLYPCAFAFSKPLSQPKSFLGFYANSVYKSIICVFAKNCNYC